MTPQDYITKGLIQRGLPAHVAQGFVMNMQDESGLNSGINEASPLVHGSRGGFGLYQLTGPRRRAYEAYASNRGIALDSADAQLDFLMTELQGPEKNAAKSIFSTNTPQEAAAAIARDFLRPSDSNLKRRIASYTGGILAPTQVAETESKMTPEEEPRGLLGSLGIQKMEEGAEGEAGQRFFQRDTFKDTAAQLAPLLASMGSSPALQKATAGIAAQRTEAKAKNKTIEFLKGLPNGEELVRIAQVAGPQAAMKYHLDSRKAPKDTRTSGLKDYAKAQSQGYEGTFIEYQSEVSGKATDGTSAGKNFETYQRIRREQGEEAAEQFRSMTKTNVPDQVRHPTLPRPLSIMEIEIDKNVAKDFTDITVSGLSSANRNAAIIKTVIQKLGATTPGEELTGTYKGMLGDIGRNIFAKDSQAALNNVAGVVQQSLREILGGQFAKQEGEALINRAYNVSAEPSVNAARLAALYTQLQTIAENKKSLIEYVTQYGTSAGFAGQANNPSPDFFIRAMEQAEKQAQAGNSNNPASDGEIASKAEEREAAVKKWIKNDNQGAN